MATSKPARTRPIGYAEEERWMTAGQLLDMIVGSWNSASAIRDADGGTITRFTKDGLIETLFKVRTALWEKE